MPNPTRSLFLALALALALAVLPFTCLPAQGEQGKQGEQGAQATPPKPQAPPMSWTGVLGEEAFAALHELRRGAAPLLLGKDIVVGGAKAYLSLPKVGKPTGAVLVIHEWWGLNDHVKHWSDRLAADGYAALAIDLYGGVVAKTREEASAAMRKVDGEAALATLKVAHAFLATDPRVRATRRACIGWCFGGGWSLRLAMAAPDLDAAVIYYGHLINSKEQLAGIRAPVLGVFGDRDRGIPPASVDAFAAAMKTAGKRLELLRYDANHAFANPSSARYDQKHASAAWREVRRFLRTYLTAAPQGRFTEGRKIAYTLPEGWQLGDQKSMRLLTARVGECECYIAVLAGTAGGVGLNINRWRQQMGQDPLLEEQLDQLPRTPMLGSTATKATISGAFKGFSGEKIDDATMLAVVCPLSQETVFVKMIGPRVEMAKQTAHFAAFCASLR